MKFSDKTIAALKELARQVLAALVAFVTALLASGCGTTTRAVVTNNRENTQTSITITTTNTNDTKVTASPDVDVLNKPN